MCFFILCPEAPEALQGLTHCPWLPFLPFTPPFCPAALVSWPFLKHTRLVPTRSLGTLILCSGLFNVKLVVHEEAPSRDLCGRLLPLACTVS